MILYHYCSNRAFYSIIEQRRLRLSLLSMSNDAKEGQHILDNARKLLPQDFEHRKDALQQLEQVISLVSAIGFCVSQDGDLLSQWRGYADNAQGVSIGFDSDELREIASAETSDDLIVKLSPVAYGQKFLDEILEEHLSPVMEHYNSGKMARPRYRGLLSVITDQQQEEEEEEQSRHKQAYSELFWMLLRIANYAYTVKSSFFKEEKEWRLLSLPVNKEDGLELPNARFSTTTNQVKPFRDFPLDGFSPGLIKEIVLGPRNQTPNDVIKLFLNSFGFSHVIIRRSTGSYN